MAAEQLDSARAGVGVVFTGPRATRAGDVRLLCFPHAGGGSSTFAGWPQRLGPRVELGAVQLPGREARILQRPFSDMDSLLPELARAALPHCQEPFALFGHSMGALVAFELARWLRANGKPQPVHLFLSARPAPHLPGIHPPNHLLPDDQLLERLGRLGGTPAALLADPQVMTIMLPLLRADFAVIDGYRYQDQPPLSCPISAYGGHDDPEVDRAGLLAWRQHTTGPFEMRMFQGGHFYLRESQAPLLRRIREVLEAVAVA